MEDGWKTSKPKTKWVKICGLFWKNCTDLYLGFFFKVINKNSIAHEICKQFCARKQSILNDISKTKFKEQKFYERRMQTVP